MPDAVAIVTTVALAIALEWDRLTGPAWLGMDTATAFFPWYSFLGQQLRAGHIPGWNPFAFSGAPFAADPESGWMYLPAMAFFALLPLDTAVRASLLFHVLLAGLSTYAFARVLGLNALGALIAAVVYSHSGFFEGHNVCCYAYADIAAWLPLSLLGAELAIRSSAWRTRSLWWGVCGLAMSQILAAWIGQGAYYAALLLGAFIAFRTFGRPRAFGVQALGVLVATATLSAAGVLPRLEYNLVSNLPGGYPDAGTSLRATAWNDWGVISDWDRLLLRPGFEYIGWGVLLLSIVGVLAWRRIPAVPFFAVMGISVLVLARAEPTPLHALFSLLPGFEKIHARSPERVLIVLYLAPALLAGASMSCLTCYRRLRPVGLVALGLIALDLHVAWLAQSAEALAGAGDYQFARVDLSAYVAPTPGAQFLLDRARSEPPFRYFGYAGHVFGGPMPYTLRWQDPAIIALQVDNRGLLTGLQDIQGYNPVHVAAYDNFVSALDGQAQNYHHADIFESGFDSPLLDLLNVRYIVMPAVLASDEVAPHFTRPVSLVYEDDSVRIFENPSVLPRAWLEGAQGSVSVNTYAPDEIELSVNASAPALLVASEIGYPAWHAYVDGQRAAMQVAHTALRAVALPPGEHVVEMRFESVWLDTGLMVSGAAALLLVGLAILQIAFKTRSRDESGEVRCNSGAVPQL